MIGSESASEPVIDAGSIAKRTADEGQYRSLRSSAVRPVAERPMRPPRIAQVNAVSVSGGGSAATANTTDSTTIVALPVLNISKSHTGSFTQGQSGATYTVTVSNAAGAGPTSGTVTVTESVPTGLTLVSMSGGATWNCTVLPACTTSTVLNGGS